MKRKGPRAIPDFSRQANPANPRNVAPSSQAGQPRVAPPPPRPAVKPQGTSMKSGRRGQ